MDPLVPNKNTHNYLSVYQLCHLILTTRTVQQFWSTLKPVHASQPHYVRTWKTGFILR